MLVSDAIKWLEEINIRASQFEDLYTADATRTLLDILQDSPEHIISVTEEGWVLTHPLECRPRLEECPYNLAAIIRVDPGKYRILKAGEGWKLDPVGKGNDS